MVFLTNVDGVFDRPPEEGDARLLEEIGVRADGRLDVNDIRMNRLDHDVTSGLEGCVLCIVIVYSMCVAASCNVPHELFEIARLMCL